MSEPGVPKELIYKRARFGTRLPLDRSYTPAHYWLQENGEGVWRVGFTKFATRMLGDLVEYRFEAEPGSAVAIGQKIGWVEGFKAVSELYAVAGGSFAGSNPALAADITLLESDPYGRGWLYEVKGLAEPQRVDAQEYGSILDTTIDRMLASRHEGYE